MPDPDPPTALLSTAEAAARLGLTPGGVRSRVRRGSLRAEHGSSGQLLVEVPVAARSAAGRVTTALPEEAGAPRRRGLAARSGSISIPPLLVPLAALLIGGVVLAYLSDRRQKG